MKNLCKTCKEKGIILNPDKFPVGRNIDFVGFSVTRKIPIEGEASTEIRPQAHGIIILQNFPMFVHFCNTEALLCNFNAPFRNSLSHILFETVLQWRIFLQAVKIEEQSFCSAQCVLCKVRCHCIFSGPGIRYSDIFCVPGMRYSVIIKLPCALLQTGHL